MQIDTATGRREISNPEFRYSFFRQPNCFGHGPEKMVHNSDYIGVGELLDKYRRRACGVILQFDMPSWWNGSYVDGVSSGTDELVPPHFHEQNPASMEHFEWWVPGGAKNGRYRPVLVSNIKNVDSMECLPLPATERLIFEKEVFDPLALGLDSVAIPPVLGGSVSNDELQVLVLISTVKTDSFPHDVVEGGAEIVDSIAYYKPQLRGDGKNKPNLHRCLSSYRICFDAESVWLLRYKSDNTGFKLRNVSLRSFDFQFGTFKHEQLPRQKAD